jgi:hypothetical protein
MDKPTYTAIFYHHSLNGPVSQSLYKEDKFIELCETFPTDWAHLMDSRTGEIVSSWSNADVSWKNN